MGAEHFLLFKLVNSSSEEAQFPLGWKLANQAMALPRCYRDRKSVTLRTPDLIPLNPNLVRVRHRGFVRYANSIPEAFLIHSGYCSGEIETASSSTQLSDLK